MPRSGFSCIRTLQSSVFFTMKVISHVMYGTEHHCIGYCHRHHIVMSIISATIGDRCYGAQNERRTEHLISLVWTGLSRAMKSGIVDYNSPDPRLASVIGPRWVKCLDQIQARQETRDTGAVY